MRLLVWVAALIVLLRPSLLPAQCEQEDWFSTTATIAPTVASIASTSPMMLLSEYDESVYTVYLLQSNVSSDVIFQIDEIQYQSESCWPGKVFLIQKRSLEGQLLWHRTGCFSTDGLVQGMTVDDEGNLYFGGYFVGDLVYESNVLDQSEVSIWSHYTLKIEPDGEVEWLRSGKRSAATGHTWTENGMLMFLAVTDSTTFNGQSFYHLDPAIPATTEYIVLMIDGQGEIVWHKHLGGYGNKFVRQVACGMSKCVFQGMYMDQITYDDLLLDDGGGRMYQIAINQLDGDGLWITKQENDGTTLVETNCSSILADGSLMTGGFYNGSPSVFSFQGGSVSSTNGLTDGFVMRQDVNTGELKWLKTLGAPGYSRVNGMASIPSGIIITGDFNSEELNFEGVTLLNHSTELDPFLILIDTTGKPMCQFSELGSSTPESGNKVLSEGNELFWLLGFNGSTSFGDFQVNSVGNGDRLIWKTCLPCDTLTSITETPTTQPALLIHPNPATHSVRLQVSGSRFQIRSVVLTDMLGHTVLSLPFGEVKTPSSASGGHSPLPGGGLELDVSGLSAGVYTVAVTLQGGDVQRERLVVQ